MPDHRSSGGRSRRSVGRPTRRHLLRAAAGIGAVGTAGCLGVAPEAAGGDLADPDGDELLERSIEEHGDLQDVFVRQRWRWTDQEDELQRTARIWRDELDDGSVRQRREIVEAAPGGSTGDVRVIDPPAVWEYSDATHTATYDEIDGSLSLGAIDHLVPLVDDWTVEHVDTETLEAGEAYVLEARPLESAIEGRSLRVLVGDTEYVIPLEREDGDVELEPGEAVGRSLWLHSELLYPIREDVEFVHPRDHEETQRVEWEYEAVRIDDGVDDDRFELDPPTDDELLLVEALPGGRMEWFDEHGALAAEAPFELPTLPAELPERFELEEGMIRDHDHLGETTVRQWFRSDDERLVLTVTGIEPMWDDGKTIDFGGTTATRLDQFGVTNLRWERAGLSYRLGSHPDSEFLLSVADSIVA